MIWLLALTVFVCITSGVYLALSRDVLRCVLGLGVLGAAANLVLFASGRLGSARPAIVPLGEQVARGQLAALHVGGFHQVAGQLGDLDFAVQQHRGDRQARQLCGQRGIVAGGHHDQPVDAALGQHLQVAALAVGLVIGVAQNDVVARPKTAVFDRVHDLCEIGVGAVGDQHAQRACVVAFEAARNGAGHVAQCTDGFFDPCAAFGTRRP